MALIWARTAGRHRYEIRRAGRTVRLYTNGVLHSQYHPDMAFGGGVWDLLGLPALWSRNPCLSGILLLGLGGGAVVRQLHELVEWQKFVAIERNPIHLEIARRFFGLDRTPAELVETDAHQWVQSHSGGKFELIIDDLFSDNQGEARRSVPFTRAWYRGLVGLLSDDGILVINFVDEQELKYRLGKIPAARRDFKCVYKLTLPAYGNAVAALIRHDRTPRDLTRALSRIKPRRRRTKLRYHLEKVVL